VLGPRQLLVARQEDLEELGVTGEQLRADVAVAGLSAEAVASGRVLRLGADVRVRLTFACEVCAKVRRRVDEATFRRLPGRRGTLGVVLSGGTVAVGDAVAVEDDRLPAVPEAIADRVAWVVARIPEGEVTTYAELIALAGGHRAHLRAVPSYLRRAAAAGLPADRVRRAGEISGDEPRWDASQLYLTGA
jgi:MOSC domain-containing protein YiiM